VLTHDEGRRGADSVAVLSATDELPDSPAGSFLHRDALGVGALTECRLLVVGEAERHGHGAMVSVRYRSSTPEPRVALLEVPCYRPVDTSGQPALPERGDDARTRLLNTLLKDATAADPAHVRFVPGPAAWCTDESVARDLGDRWDGVHYYKPGAARVFDAITKDLVAISSL
jgi:hypothetical protein